jgi:protein-disulfide isomerase
MGGTPVGFWCTGWCPRPSYSDFVPVPREVRILLHPSKPTIQMAQNRKTAGRHGSATASAKKSKKPFYIGLAVAAVAGVAALSYITSQAAKSRLITVDPNLPPVTSEGYVMGSPDAKVELIEFGDFECPGCGGFAELTEPEIRRDYVNTGKIRFRFIDTPLISIHRNTMNASNAAACADEQGKFWEMHDRIFGTMHIWSGQATSDPDPHFKTLAREIQGIDASKFDDCVESRRMVPKVQAHLKIANDRGINGTPTFILGNQQFGGLPMAQWRQVLDSAVAAASGAAASTTKKP